MRMTLGCFLASLLLLLQIGCSHSEPTAVNTAIPVSKFEELGLIKPIDAIEGAYTSVEPKDALPGIGDLAAKIAGSGWLNSEPLTSEDLLGKLVVVIYGEPW
jgi:hypothetical protein